MREKDINCKWIINSTGSNTVGTPFINEMTEYLKNKGFEKLFKGNPEFYTDRDYSHDELEHICNDIMNMRKKYGQYIPKIKCSYFKVEMGHKFEYTDEDANEYKNNYIKNRKPLSDEEMIKEYKD